MSIRTALIGAGVGLLLAAAVGVAWRTHGTAQYRAGYAQAKTDAALAAAALSEGIQYERDRADAEHRGAVLAREAADRLVADQRKRIDGLLDQLRRRPAPARAEPGTDGTGEDWIGIFGQCVAAYEDMGREAGRLADKVNGLQGYVKAIRSKQPG